MKRIKELGVQLVKLDMTGNDPEYKAELNRCGMKNLPVNLLYPADYPESPAIMLPEFLSPGIALEALDRVAPPEDPAETPAEAELAKASAETE